MHRDDAGHDPLIVLNGLDNDDKHRLLHTSYMYPGAIECTGIDLIQIVKPSRVLQSMNSWTAGHPLEHGTALARFMVRNPEEGILRARPDAQVGFAIGDLGAGRTQFTDMIERVRRIVDEAAACMYGKG
ncbi:MAG: hypothetical protein QOE11_14 [Solirubrobacteraceae bacterium]|jgi:hypothetical protein|nr:hypothetical protein [Solirubrobacteraceae bacterium]